VALPDRCLVPAASALVFGKDDAHRACQATVCLPRHPQSRTQPSTDCNEMNVQSLLLFNGIGQWQGPDADRRQRRAHSRVPKVSGSHDGHWDPSKGHPVPKASNFQVRCVPACGNARSGIAPDPSRPFIGHNDGYYQKKRPRQSGSPAGTLSLKTSLTLQC
jgi:hypothetical protein